MCKILVLLLVFFCFFLVTNAIVCRDGFTLVNNKCILLLTIARSNREFFQSGCASLGGKLVSIHTAIDNNAIAKYATGQGNSEAICIGLTCYKDNDPANCLWADQLGNASRYNNFQPGYPQFNNGSSVYMTPSTGKWVSGNCDNLLNAICETDMIGECSYKFGDNCYYPLAVPFHHYEELNICEQMCSGSLVSIHSPEENEYIRGLFIDPSITSINIGAMLSRENYWSDGTTWDYENFNHSSIHDGRCYSMSINDGKWNSINCSSFPAPTICKWKASSECRKTCTEPIYREKTGYIYSPGYYYYFTKYRGISPCYYVLHVPSDSAVIWFRSLNLDSKSSIELYSDTGNSTPIAVITQGNQNYYYNTPLTSPSQLIKLVYNQCESNCDLSAFYGWKAQFGTNYGAKCGEILYTTGVISSQNYPNNYPNNYGCSYYFQNAGENIDIKFDHFETEKNRDFVNIYDMESGTLLDSFSGNVQGGYIVRYKSSLRIEFITDKSKTFSGWSARIYNDY